MNWFDLDCEVGLWFNFMIKSKLHQLFEKKTHHDDDKLCLTEQPKAKNSRVIIHFVNASAKNFSTSNPFWMFIWMFVKRWIVDNEINWLTNKIARGFYKMIQIDWKNDCDTKNKRKKRNKEIFIFKTILSENEWIDSFIHFFSLLLQKEWICHACFW